MIKKVQELIQKKGGLGKFIRYALVGVSAVFVDFTVFELLLLLLENSPSIAITQTFEPEKIANTVAVFVGFIYSFILNRSWAFKSKENALRQIILMLLLLLFNTFVSNEAISFMGRQLGFPFAIAKPIMQVAVALWNYVIYDKIIYRS